MNKLAIEIKIISDIQCPWCIVGLSRLKQAMEFNKDKYNFSIYFSPYLLNPNIPEKGVNYADYFKAKGMTDINLTRMQKMMKPLVDAGREFDKPILFKTPTEDMTMYNTINAHRVSEWCLKEYGREKQVELYEHMIRNYFEKRINVHDYDILGQLAEEAGFEKKKVVDFLKDPEARPTSAEIQQMAQNNQLESGAQGVPFFVINNQIAFSGAQDSLTFTQIFEQIRKEPQFTEQQAFQ